MCVAKFPKNTNLPPAQHAGEEFAYVLDGAVLLRVEDVEYRLSAGDSFQLRGSEPHSVCTEDEEAEVLFFQTVKYTEWGTAQAMQARPPLAAAGVPEPRRGTQNRLDEATTRRRHGRRSASTPKVGLGESVARSRTHSAEKKDGSRLRSLS